MTQTPPEESENQAEPPPLPMSATADSPTKPIVPPPLPPEVTQPVENRKKMRKSGRTQLLTGLGMMAFEVANAINISGWETPKKMGYMTLSVIAPSLAATWLIEHFQQKWKPLGLDTFRGVVRDKFLTLWQNHGSGYYGIIALFYLMQMELTKIIAALPNLTFNLGAIIQFLLVDRFMGIALGGWQAFLWPVTWMSEMGALGGIGAMLAGFGAFEYIRLAAGADTPVDALSAESS